MGFHGKKHSIETRKKMREIALKNGNGKWNKGKHLLPEQIEKFKISIKKYKRTREHSMNIVKARRKNGSYIYSDEVKKKIRESRIRGENHFRWKGGISPINQKIRSTIEFRNWRRKVFERDNFLCQKCFIKNKRLNAHHDIKQFHILVKEARERYPDLPIIEACKKYESFFDVNNGLTLCVDCHKAIHKKK